LGCCRRWQEEEKEKEERLVSWGGFFFFASLACDLWQSVTLLSPHNTNSSPGKTEKTTRKRKKRRKKRKPPPPLLLLLKFQRIRRLLIRWKTNGAVSPQQAAKRRKARRAKLLSLNLCQSQSQSQNPNHLLNQSPNRSQHQPPRPQQTTGGDFLRPAKRRRARKARSVMSLYSCISLSAGVVRIGVSPPDGVIIRAAPRVSGQGWVA